jgi:hypothetical protein
MPIYSNNFTVGSVEALYTWASYINEAQRLENNNNLANQEKQPLLSAISELLTTPHNTRAVVKSGSITLSDGNKVALPTGWRGALSELSDLGFSTVPIFSNGAEDMFRVALRALDSGGSRDHNDRLTVSEADTLSQIMRENGGYNVVDTEDPRPKLGAQFPDDAAETKRLYDLRGDAGAKSSAELFTETAEAKAGNDGRAEDDRRGGGRGPAAP